MSSFLNKIQIVYQSIKIMFSKRQRPTGIGKTTIIKTIVGLSPNTTDLTLNSFAFSDYIK